MSLIAQRILGDLRGLTIIAFNLLAMAAGLFFGGVGSPLADYQRGDDARLEGFEEKVFSLSRRISASLGRDSVVAVKSILEKRFHVSPTRLQVPSEAGASECFIDPA